MEAMFVLCDTAKDDDALKAYMIDGEREKMWITKKLLADKDSPLSKDRLEILWKFRMNLMRK